MKILSIIPILFFCLSCNNKNIKIAEQSDNSEFKDYQNEVMKEEDILFNGKLKRYFTLNEFENVFGKPDSIKLMSEEKPCSYIFENEDGSKDLQDKYLYKNGSQFENTKEKVAVNEFRFIKNNYILFKGIRLNSSTSINELEKIFPNAMKDIETLDVYKEGKLQVIKLREDENNVSDGHIKIFIKNNKLYFMHWWFPC